MIYLFNKLLPEYFIVHNSTSPTLLHTVFLINITKQVLPEPPDAEWCFTERAHADSSPYPTPESSAYCDPICTHTLNPTLTLTLTLNLTLTLTSVLTLTLDPNPSSPWTHHTHFISASALGAGSSTPVSQMRTLSPREVKPRSTRLIHNGARMQTRPSGSRNMVVAL